MLDDKISSSIPPKMVFPVSKKMDDGQQIIGFSQYNQR